MEQAGRKSPKAQRPWSRAGRNDRLCARNAGSRPTKPEFYKTNPIFSQKTA
jgi:hypothetical protein